MSGMPVYIVVIVDRHHAPHAHVFSTEEKAIRYAIGWAEENGAKDTADEAVPGWLYCNTYGVEDDYVYVQMRRIDEEDA
jgi:hypothetical protein